ncbi:MAG: ATP-binding protein [Candidatus Peribacteria bacterium]|nr:MAG: ATP-binding protein [Candidatus Peribacteria bacterium]
MDEGFESNLPLAIDNLGITRSTITSSMAGSFPFISQDIIHDTGILYGVNLHTGGLVIFDRFRKGLPNMNSVVLATSGAGKSFTVKLEILRYLLMGIDIIVIDPENEYKSLIDKVGGTYINIATNSQQYINPFDLPPAIEDVEYGEGDILRSHIMNILGLMKILVGEMSAQEEAILDKALQNVYALKGIDFSTTDYSDKQPPMMEDLLQVLQGMEGGEDLSLKISKYVTGTFGKIFNNETNVDLNSQLTVFSIRDLEDALKTPAMFNVLNYIWTKIRSHKKPRLIICDEAWIMLQHDISANFLFGLTKRARKYGAGITTISQDIEDLVRSPYGKPIISNSAMQILLKQSTSSIKALSEIVGLSEAEKQRLVASNIGEGLIFTGDQHVAIKILASPEEEQFITTDVGST